MITIVEGDILKSPISEVICHQTNCIGKFGSGVAGAIRRQYPGAYELYREYVGIRGMGAMGTIQPIYMEDGRLICNMFAQASCGYDGKKYTDSLAFEECLYRIKDVFPSETVIAMPYMIGCGLGGGSWEEIYGILQKRMSDRKLKLYRI